jgi:dTMP kinase
VQKYLDGFYGDPYRVDPWFAAKLFADDRFAYKEAIIKAINKGNVIMLDRWVLSNMAFQSGKIPAQNKELREKILCYEYVY